MALVIGITGSISTGKSLVCQTLVELGAVHGEGDKLVHRMYDPGTLAFDRIVGIFGGEVVGEDGYIDRRILGAKVFGKPEAMSKLTLAIGDTVAEVKKVVDQWRVELPGDGVAVLETPNLIERGIGQWCDVIWLTACDHDLARQRLMLRNQFSGEEADQRLANQVPWEGRAAAADWVIQNNGSADELVARVREEYHKIIQLRAAGGLPESRYLNWWREHSPKK